MSRQDDDRPLTNDQVRRAGKALGRLASSREARDLRNVTRLAERKTWDPRKLGSTLRICPVDGLEEERRNPDRGVRQIDTGDSEELERVASKYDLTEEKVQEIHDRLK